MRTALTIPADAIDLATIDLLDPALYADGEPHAVFRALRHRAPVFWQKTARGVGFWAVTRHADVTSVLRDHETFSSERGTLLNLLGLPEPAGGQQLATTDPPRHSAMRAPLQRMMAGRVVERGAARISAKIRRLLAGELAGGREEGFDLAALTAKLPRVMLAPLMGVPEEDWPMLHRWICAAHAETDPAYAMGRTPQETLDRAHRELFAYLVDLVRGQRSADQENLVSILLDRRTEGGALSPGSVVANCYALIVGAGAAIAHVPNATLVELMRGGRYPAWADGWTSGALAPRPAVEEAIRWASPAGHLMRYATRATRIGGVEIAAGDYVAVWLGSANRDEEVFDLPYTLDPRRTPNRHVAFGGGHHTCLGSAIARATLREFFSALFAEFADFRPAGEVVHVRSNWTAGMKEVPVVGRRRT